MDGIVLCRAVDGEITDVIYHPCISEFFFLANTSKHSHTLNAVGVDAFSAAELNIHAKCAAVGDAFPA